MSKFNRGSKPFVYTKEIELFKNNPRAFVNYNLRTNLIDGGSVEASLSQYELKAALNEENFLKYPILLAHLLNKNYIGAN